MSFLRPNLLFENNDIHDNSTVNVSSLSSVMQITDGVATVKGNRIHHNLEQNNAPLLCNGGIIDIRGNLICNNQNIVGTCGAVDGGGGIHVSTNGSGDIPNTFYTIRNNVIANNYTPFVGGAIKVLWANVSITNNQIINNKSDFGSGGIVLSCDTFSATIKNNVFLNNVGGGVVNPDVYVYSARTLTYENNWSEYQFCNDVYLMPGGFYTLGGDTTTNIVGTSPCLKSPTLLADVTENAMSPRDFSLLATSPCINAGDTAGVWVDTFDYAGNSRIYGPRIDIGAFEYNPAIVLHGASATTTTVLGLYPNPASNIVFVATPDANGTIDIADATGKTILSCKVTDRLTSFDVHSIARGTYFAVWNTTNGRQVQKLTVD
jgi:hypothetical protein